MRRPTASLESDGAGRAFDRRLLWRLWSWVRPHRALVAASFVLLVGVSAAQIAQPWLLKRAIDEGIARGDTGALLVPAGLFLLALVAEFVLRYLQLYALEATGQNVILDLRVAVFSHLQHLSASFFDRNPVGRLMTRVTSDIEALNEAFTSGLVLILADLVKLVGIVVVLFAMDWRLALVTLAVLPLMLGVTAWFRRRMRAAYRRVRARVAALAAFLQEAVVGMRLIQVFGRERRSREEFDEVNRGHRDAELGSVLYDSLFSAVAELMGTLTLAAILWAGGFRLLAGGITFGTLVAFIEYAGKFFRPVQELSQRFAVMQGAMASAERVFELLDTPPEIASPPSPRELPPPRGEVVFDDVSFAYRPGEPVLENISFRVEPGEKLGIVGWTGSGKSTLIRLLARLYDVDSGRILLDGLDVRDWPLDELRRRLGVVLQDQFLFAGTIADNISLGDPRITREDIRRAARLVQADAFIERLPRGYDEPVRERGSNLSVGEKQLICFARALAFDPAVIVLDEATASVDPETEERITRAIEIALAGRTALVIAHRLHTVLDADRILVLHHGRLAEQGTHDELIARDGGIYRTLWELQ
ncbi:MAG: ABC transporter ATP-binding protein, partial [Acidobacteria bacterium]